MIRKKKVHNHKAFYYRSLKKIRYKKKKEKRRMYFKFGTVLPLKTCLYMHTKCIFKNVLYRVHGCFFHLFPIIFFCSIKVICFLFVFCLLEYFFPLSFLFISIYFPLPVLFINMFYFTLPVLFIKVFYFPLPVLFIKVFISHYLFCL